MQKVILCALGLLGAGCSHPRQGPAQPEVRLRTEGRARDVPGLPLWTREPFRLRETEPLRPVRLSVLHAEAGTGDTLATTLLRAIAMPVAGIRPSALKDSFGSPRSGHAHSAIDIHAPLGTRVLASVDGTVWKIRSDRGGGLTVHLLDSSGRFVFYYAHLSRYAAGLREGQRMTKGALLGYVGRTGKVNGSPHLHLRIGRTPKDPERLWDGDALNPYPLLKHAVIAE